MPDYLGWVTRAAHSQVRVDRSQFQNVIGIDSGLEQLIEDTVKHLGTLDQEMYDELYDNEIDKRDYTVLGSVLT